MTCARGRDVCDESGIEQEAGTKKRKERGLAEENELALNFEAQTVKNGDELRLVLWYRRAIRRSRRCGSGKRSLQRGLV